MKQAPETADVQVGANIRRLRAERGISQTDLADAIGVTFQQVQKYEKGTNRVSASRLVDVANFMGVKVEVLFSGVNGADTGAAAPLPIFSREAINLVSDFEAIADPAVRTSIRGLVKSLSRQQVADAA